MLGGWSLCFDSVVVGLRHCFDSVVDGVMHKEGPGESEEESIEKGLTKRFKSFEKLMKNQRLEWSGRLEK